MRRENGDDFRELGFSFAEAFEILRHCQIPPSLEVFIEELEHRKPTTPQALARAIATRYRPRM